ncbi:ferrous iron transport protein A [Bacillota bacterium Meth-B3]|nr:FeoA family protein [Christensenellaceae bacterium]MEA5068615.1 FeoA family protein [Christensenellaceae bacterium]
MANRELAALNALGNEEEAVVERIDVEGRARRRLVEMGITPGTRVMISRRAPLGDPMEIRLRGYQLTLREADARQILVSRGGGRA